MIYSLFLFGLIEHLHVWAYSSDIWLVVDGGRFVWHGALGYVYQGSGSYSLPLSFIVMAPVSGLIDHYALEEGSPFPIGHPSAWLLVGPYTLLFGVFLLHAVRRLAWDLATTWKTLGRSVGGGHHHSGTGVSMGSLRGRSSCHLRSSRSAQAARPRLRSRCAAPIGGHFVQADRCHAHTVPAVHGAIRAATLTRRRLCPAGCSHCCADSLSPVNLVKHYQGHSAVYLTWLGSKTSQVSRTIGLLGARSRNQRRPQVLLHSVLIFGPSRRPLTTPTTGSPGLLFAGLVGIAVHRQVRLKDG